MLHLLLGSLHSQILDTCFNFRLISSMLKLFLGGSDVVVGWVGSCSPCKFCSDVCFCMKVILLQMELITSTDVVRNLCKKMAPPLVTLLSAEPEIQYVALRNINLIVQRRPGILAHEIKVYTESSFFDFNDIELVPREKYPA